MKLLDPSKVVVTPFPPGAESVHGTCAHAGVIWCGTRQIPAQVVCFDASTLAVIDAIVMPSDGIDEGSLYYPGMEQIVCHLETGLMYGNCHGDMLSSVRVVEMWLQDGLIQHRDVVAEEWDWFDGEQQSTLAVIEIDQERGILYAGMWDSDNHASIRRYSLSSRDESGLLLLIDEYRIESDAPFLYGIHSLVCEGDYLYVTSQTQPAWVAKIDISNEAMSTEDFFYFPTGFNTITDDSCYCDGYLFCGFEFDPHKGTIVRIDAANLSVFDVIEFPYDASCFGVYNIEGVIYAVHYKDRPIITIINPQTLERETFTVEGLSVSPNELVCYNGVFFMPTWKTWLHGDTVLLSCPKINFLNGEVSGVEFSIAHGAISVTWIGHAPTYLIEVSETEDFLAPQSYETLTSDLTFTGGYGRPYWVRITPIDGAVVADPSPVYRYDSPPFFGRLDAYPLTTVVVVSWDTLDTFTGATIEITSGLSTYFYQTVQPAPQRAGAVILPNMFPGEETTITLAVGDQVASTTFMAAEVAREVIESSGITRLTEDKQSIVYARGSGAYAILTTSSGHNNKYGVLAFVINEDNEIVLNDSMTSDYLYSDLSVSGEKPFLLNDETPFGVNLKYAWRGSNTDALEICVKLCLQGE